MGLGGERTTGGPAWCVPSRRCDSCKRASAALFCRADSAFLCLVCDEEIHGANKLASRHERVCLCEVCEQAPASVTCRADAAALCSACDADIHSANPLASRHDRLPVVPFLCPSSNTGAGSVLKSSDVLHGGVPTLSLPLPPLPEDTDVLGIPDVGEKVKGKTVDAFFNDPCFDFDFGNSDGLNGSGTEGLVPVHAKPEPEPVDVLPEKCLDMDLGGPSKFASFSFPIQSFTQTVYKYISQNKSLIDLVSNSVNACYSRLMFDCFRCHPPRKISE